MKLPDALTEAARALNDAAVSHKRAAAYHRQRAKETRQKLAIVLEQARAWGVEIMLQGEEEKTHGQNTDPKFHYRNRRTANR